jgi:hypothetical protein
LNQNKLNGTRAEIDFRDYINGLGFQGRVSPGGWIVRRKGPGVFAHSTAALFPEVVMEGAGIPTKSRVAPAFAWPPHYMRNFSPKRNRRILLRCNDWWE